MPELPEVETIKRGLFDFVLKKKIVKVKVFENKSFLGSVSDVEGNCINNLYRLGKALFFELSNGKTMMAHLRMTGQIVYVGKTERFGGGHPSENFVDILPNKQTRIEFELDDGSKMFFNDQRKFGFFKVIDSEKVESEAFVKKLGKEPFFMSGGELYKKIKNKSANIKSVLLDQTVMSGLGNIYTDETLFDVGILPTRTCNTLTEKECEQIVCSARKVLNKSIDAGGSTIKNYVKADGTRGDYLKLFAKVYGREGEICEKCGAKIKKMRTAGRGTYYCERCQK